MSLSSRSKQFDMNGGIFANDKVEDNAGAVPQKKKTAKAIATNHIIILCGSLFLMALT